MPHSCDATCACPIHRTPLIYSARLEVHACREPTCLHAHGVAEPVPDPAEVPVVVAPLPAGLAPVRVQAVSGPSIVPGARRFRRAKRKSRYGHPGVRPTGSTPALDGVTVYGPFQASARPVFAEPVAS